jgi:hypothetical protein
MGAEREMSDIDDRLRALDPFANAPYEHTDTASMLERITQGAAPRRSRRRLAVRLGPIAVASAAGLAAIGVLVTAGTPAVQLAALHVTGGHVAAGYGTSAAPRPLQLTNGTADRARWVTYGALGALPMSFGEAQGGQALAATTWNTALTSTTLSLGPSFTYLYELGSLLPASAPPVDAFAAIAPKDPERVLSDGAARLGLSGALTRDAAGTWQLGSEANPRQVRIAALVRSKPSGLLTFRYLRGDVVRLTSRCATGSRSGAADTDRLAMSSSLMGLLRSLGARYSIGDPTFTTAWSRSGRAGCEGTALVTASVLVGDEPTDLSVQMAFDPTGSVAAAAAPVFTSGTGARYPLVSPARAAASLVASSIGDADRSSAGAPAVVPKGANATNDEWSTAHLMVVELHSPMVGLDAFATTSGTTWLLPVYAFTGDGYAQGAASQNEWSGDVLAAAAPLVRVRGSVDNQAAVFDLRVVASLP